MEKIKEFLSQGSGDGDGSDDGYGSGSGSGDGDGYGYGYGDGDGYGSGYGYGYKLNSKLIHNIDNVSTIIKSAKGKMASGYVANGYIVNNDLTLTKTYIAKNGDIFAHGETLKKAIKSLESKIIAELNVNERIDKFLGQIDTDKQYPASYFFDWHGTLTGSCEQGRLNFMTNNNIADTDTYNLKEFIDLTEKAYGSEVISIIKRRVNSNEGNK